MKNFKKNTPLNNLTASSNQDTESVSTPIKRKVGRPKTKDVKGTCRNINIAVPITLLNQWEEVKRVHGSNLTAYVTKLIEKDMETNYEKYKAAADILENM